MMDSFGVVENEIVHEFSDDTAIPQALPFDLWRFVAVIETLKLTMSILELSLPQVQSALLDLECFLGSFCAVLFPECEYTDSLIRFFLNHIPEAYHTLPRTDEPLCTLEFGKSSLLWRDQRVQYVSGLMHT